MMQLRNPDLLEQLLIQGIVIIVILLLPLLWVLVSELPIFKKKSNLTIKK